MNEQTSDLSDVVLSIGWKCDSCGERGTLNLGRKIETPAIVQRLKALHREQSPKCKRVNMGPTELAPLAIDEGAVVNDPLAKARIVIGGPRQRPLGGLPLFPMVGAAALSVPAGQPIKDFDRPEPQPAENPYSPEAREAAREESRLRNAQSRLAAADAKRQRKAERRRGQR